MTPSSEGVFHEINIAVGVPISAVCV